MFSAFQREAVGSLLETGAAAGADSALFAATGLSVVSTDLSPEMIQRCRERGLEAHVMDITDLRFDADSFDAAYAKNCFAEEHLQEIVTRCFEICSFERVMEGFGGYHYCVAGLPHAAERRSVRR